MPPCVGGEPGFREALQFPCRRNFQTRTEIYEIAHRLRRCCVKSADGPGAPNGSPAVTTTTSPALANPSCCAARTARPTISVIKGSATPPADAPPRSPTCGARSPPMQSDPRIGQRGLSRATRSVWSRSRRTRCRSTMSATWPAAADMAPALARSGAEWDAPCNRPASGRCSRCVGILDRWRLLDRGCRVKYLKSQ